MANEIEHDLFIIQQELKKGIIVNPPGWTMRWAGRMQNVRTSRFAEINRDQPGRGDHLSAEGILVE
jgi:hypothetical protein